MRKSKQSIIKQSKNKVPYNLDRQTAKVSAFSLGNVSKYEFVTGKDVLPEKQLLGKAATIKRYWIITIAKKLQKTISRIRQCSEIS